MCKNATTTLWREGIYVLQDKEVVRREKNQYLQDV